MAVPYRILFSIFNTFHAAPHNECNEFNEFIRNISVPKYSEITLIILDVICLATNKSCLV